MSLRTREGMAPGVSGTELHWRFWTPRAPRAHLFLVHGLGEHSGRYEEMAERLGESGLSVFAFDLRGHGLSEGPRGDATAFRELLADVVRMEAVFSGLISGEGPGQGPRLIFGHSLGGLIALLRLQEASGPGHGYRGAVVSAPWLASPLPSWMRGLARGLAGVVPAMVLPTGLAPDKLTSDPAKAREWREDPLVHSRLTARLFREVDRVQKVGLRRGEALRGFPILFLVPERDPVVRTAATLEFVRGIDDDGHRVEILRDRRHEALNDLGRDEVYSMMLSWIREVVPDIPDSV